MTINQVSYQKTFNLGNYSSERIGVEIVLNEGEDAKEALNTAKALVEEYHKENNVLNSLPYPYDVVFGNGKLHPYEPLPEIKVEKEQPREQTLEEQIRSCTELNVLKAYQLLVKKDPILQEAYNQTMSNLTIK